MYAFSLVSFFVLTDWSDSWTQSYICDRLIPIDRLEKNPKTPSYTVFVAGLRLLLPHTPPSLPSSLTLPQHFRAARGVNRERIDSDFTHSTGRSRRQCVNAHTHSDAHAQGDNRRQTETSVAECPLAAVRHVGGVAALLAVPALFQSCKHLPSPPVFAPWSAVAKGLAGMTRVSRRHKKMH